MYLKQQPEKKTCTGDSIANCQCRFKHQLFFWIFKIAKNSIATKPKQVYDLQKLSDCCCDREVVVVVVDLVQLATHIDEGVPKTTNTIQPTYLTCLTGIESEHPLTFFTFLRSYFFMGSNNQHDRRQQSPSVAAAAAAATAAFHNIQPQHNSSTITNSHREAQPT